MLAVINKISDASEANPYLVVIEPGIYDVGSTPVVMKDYVDIQGSGQGMTTIKGSVIGTNTGLIVGAHMTELRQLTIKNTGAGGEVAAIHNESTLMRVTEVTAEARGGGSNFGVRNLSASTMTMTDITATAGGFTGTNYGIYNQNASSTMTNVTASATGWFGTTNIGVYNLSASLSMTSVTVKVSGGDNTYGLWSAFSSPILNQVSVTATNGSISNIGIQLLDGQVIMNHTNVLASGGTTNYGIYGSGSLATLTIRVNHSVISGGTSSVFIGSLSTCYLGNTQLIGNVAGSGTKKCAGVYDGNYTFFPSTCP